MSVVPPTSTDASLRYGRTAIVLHWLLAVAITATFAVGLYMASIPMSPTRFRLVNWHKWAGMSILFLSVVRLIWRLSHRPPTDVTMPAWQERAARWAHRLLYVAFLTVPVAGWAYSSAAGRPVVMFGVLPLPDLVAPDKAMAQVLRRCHEVLAWSLAGLVGLHLASGDQASLRGPRRPAWSHPACRLHDAR